MSRPEYVKCVMLGYGELSDECGMTWCGNPKDMFDWQFSDATHALLNVRNGGRLLICKQCAAAMAKTLKEGTP